ncbi:MAG: ATP-binding cassette domain-containing protein [Ruminococcaceae bacterium]|nr:ATP-binding cassette domain-containing protein [Oscillospiraceae bacterium]
MAYIVETKNLTKSFSKKVVVDNISLSIERGSLFAFLGENGAGKTTTINMILGLLKPDSWQIFYNGSSDFMSFKNKIGVVFQNNMMDDFLTVKENLLTYGALYNNTRTEAFDKYIKVVSLLSIEDFVNQRFGTLSGGQKRKSEIARALLSSPEILFLDEPTTGLDPKTRSDVWTIINGLRGREGMSIFLTTHYMEEANDADKISIIDKGKIVVTGSPYELKTNYSVDRLIITPFDSEKFESFLKADNLKYELIGSSYAIEFKSTADSLALLNSAKENVRFYEVIKGSLDDVFLNIVGEKIKTDGGSLMSAINALYKRNSRLFLRDRMTLFFSFLSALILVALYFLFIAKLYTESMSSLSSGSSGFSLDANSKNFIVYLQMMAGVLVLNSISLAMGVFSIIAKDFENRKVDSFLLTPVKPYKLVLAYFFTGLIVSFFINAVTWIITVFIIGFATGFWILIPTFLSCMLVLFISSIISCSMMLLVVTLTKSSTAIGVINGVLGSFMGFLCGIYIPYYNLGEKTVMIG